MVLLCTHLLVCFVSQCLESPFLPPWDWVLFWEMLFGLGTFVVFSLWCLLFKQEMLFSVWSCTGMRWFTHNYIEGSLITSPPNPSPVPYLERSLFLLIGNLFQLYWGSLQFWGILSILCHGLVWSSFFLFDSVIQGKVALYRLKHFIHLKVDLYTL